MTYHAPDTTHAPRKNRRKWPWIVLAALAVIIVIAVSANTGSDTTAAPTDNAMPTLPVLPTAPAPDTPAADSDDHAGLPVNGKLKVGTDIAPGNYKATPVRGGMGYAARCSDRNCQIGGGLIDNYMITGPGYLEILPTDAFVEVQGLQLTPEA